MAPSPTPGGLPDGVSAYVLAEEGIQYAVYVCRSEKDPPEEDIAVGLELELPAGTYEVEWLDTLTGETDERAALENEGGACMLASPAFREDVALRVTAANA
ncbi:MAG: hypothetical protein QGI83_23205 [Candidatus Latescibacteria bacterium]|jgi:hypothetical protein|nr:hypothetical protein [Candidatus Latescibacterota bacterium]